MADRVALEARRAERLLLLEQARVALEDAGHAVQVGGEGGVGELRLDAGEVRLERRDVRAGVADRLAHGARVAGDELREVGDDRPAAQAPPRRRRVVAAGEEAQQGGLAGAVRADQADPGAGRKVEVEASMRSRTRCRPTARALPPPQRKGRPKTAAPKARADGKKSAALLLTPPARSSSRARNPPPPAEERGTQGPSSTAPAPLRRAAPRARERHARVDRGGNHWFAHSSAAPLSSQIVESTLFGSEFAEISSQTVPYAVPVQVVGGYCR